MGAFMKGDSNPMRRPEIAAKQGATMKGDRNPMRRNPDLCHLKGKTGPAHPTWKGGTDDYRGPESEWQEARAQVMKRAGGKCERRCGRKAQVVHHTETPEDGKSWNNADLNLEALCRSCHAKEHGLGISVRGP